MRSLLDIRDLDNVAPFVDILHDRCAGFHNGPAGVRDKAPANAENIRERYPYRMIPARWAKKQ